MPPKHDLRGGNASEDSFAMSSNILAASTNRCFLAVGRQRVGKMAMTGLLQDLCSVAVPPPDGGRFRRTPDIALEQESEGDPSPCLGCYDVKLSGCRHDTGLSAPTVC